MSSEKTDGRTNYQYMFKEVIILQFEKEGVVYAYRWSECQDIMEWIHENIKYILSDDRFPLSISADSAAEKCEIISWDNTNTFKEDGIKFVFPKGRYEVDINVFEKIMKEVCALYKDL